MSLLDLKLQTFVAIVRSGTVHGAAKNLGITQTGATQRILALEKQLSVTLFIRSRTGMKLSHEGETLLRYCERAIDLEGSIMGGISGQSTQSTVSVTLAGPTSIMSSRVLPNCLGLYQEFPQLVLNYRMDDQENRVGILKKGIVQLAILPPQDVTLEMDSKLLRPDRYVLVAGHQWKKRRTLDIIKNERMIDFYESDNTTKDYLKHYGLLEHARPDRVFANTNFAVVNLIKSGIGYGTLTQEVAATDIANGGLIVLNQKQVYEDPQALAWYPRREMPRYFRRIIECVGR